MADLDAQKVTLAATAVMKSLEPLSADECRRVLSAAAALHGLFVSGSSDVSPGRAANGNLVGGSEVGEGTSEVKRPSIVELLREKAPATNAQRVAVFAFYREHIERKPKFSRRDLEHYFADAKLPKPGNFDRDFSGAIREGWVHEDGSDSYLTQAGEDAVHRGFGGKAKPRGAAVTQDKRTRSD